jgi:hypothetical protein
MKIIKTSGYMKKEGLFNSLPGDPGLPPGVTQRQIDQPETTDIEGQRMEWQVERGNQTIPITVIYNVQMVEGQPVPTIYNTLDLRGDDIEITTEEGDMIEETIRDQYTPGGY